MAKAKHKIKASKAYQKKALAANGTSVAKKDATRAPKGKKVMSLGASRNGVDLPGGNAPVLDKKLSKEARRARKLQRRKQQHDQPPPPTNLVARLDAPKKSKYHSYFEFAENTEKKEKPLNFLVTNEIQPYPGYKFVPVGDPIMTNKCKELSREQDAMIYIVTRSHDHTSKISEHVHRSGYHFREVIVDQARAIVGSTTASTELEPIPKTQAEINKQADDALRDLFPRIPNTDRQMIIDHAFKLGNVFNGSEVVGLQTHLPLSRRVQLAVLAHIRHNHTRYDLLLRETSWENARKVVEPVCLDFILKWRGDEETGRDQMDEILREIVVLTDSDDDSSDSSDDVEDGDDDSSDSDDTSDQDEGDSCVSEEDPQRNISIQPPVSITHPRGDITSGQGIHSPEMVNTPRIDPVHELSSQAVGSTVDLTMHEARLQRSPPRPYAQQKRPYRGFARYQAAWDEAVSRRDHGSTIFDEPTTNRAQQLPVSQPARHIITEPVHSDASNIFGGRYYTRQSRQEQSRPSYSDHSALRTDYREEVIVRPRGERSLYDSRGQAQRGTPYYINNEQAPVRVVRNSPRHGLQDMLVPSIEQGSSDASHNFENNRRQIIVIDDSPPQKRRRIIDNDGSSQVGAVPSRDEYYMSRPAGQQDVSSFYSRSLIPLSSQPIPSYDAIPADVSRFASRSGAIAPEYERIPTTIGDSAPSRPVILPQRHYRQTLIGSQSPLSYHVLDHRPRIAEDDHDPIRYGSDSARREFIQNDFHSHSYPHPNFVDQRQNEDSSQGFVTIRRAQSPVQDTTRYGSHGNLASTRHYQTPYDERGAIEDPRLPLRQRPNPPPRPSRRVIILD